MDLNSPAGRVGVWVLVGYFAGIAACTKDSPTQPSQSAAPTLTAPLNDSPSDDLQLSTLQPTLRVTNGTSTTTGTRAYEFQVADSDAFTTIAAVAASIPEDAGGKTSWTVGSALPPTTRYWWRARVVQGSTTGPWSTATRFRSRIQGYMRNGEVYDPLVNGESVGAPANVSLGENGARFTTLDSLITYALPQPLTAGEFSARVTGLTTNSAGDKTKILSMQEGQSDITDNRFRATIEKRFNGEISFRFISGGEVVNADRVFLTFDPAMTYFWRFTWGNGVVRLLIAENDATGHVMFDETKGYSGVYQPIPHFAYIGAPIPRGGADGASVPGMVVKDVWLSIAPRPAALGSALRRE